MRSRLQRIGLFVLAFGVAVTGMSRCVPAPHIHAQGIYTPTDSGRPIPDPWGRVGYDIAFRDVMVGGRQCAVMISRQHPPTMDCSR